MTEPRLAKPRHNYIYAALAAAVGAYFLAVGLGLFPIPGGPSNLHGPLWLLACAGLAFFFAGVAIACQTLGHANAAGDLHAAAPRWMRALQYLIGDRQRNISAKWTNHMLAAYKPALRQYLVSNHYMDTLAFHTISGRELIDKFGYKACP